MRKEFLEWLEKLKGAKNADEFKEIWREYIEGVRVGSLPDYWISKIIDRWGGPGGIFVAMKEGKEIVTDGDLKTWAIERAGSYEYREAS